MHGLRSNYVKTWLGDPPWTDESIARRQGPGNQSIRTLKYRSLSNFCQSKRGAAAGHCAGEGPLKRTGVAPLIGPIEAWSLTNSATW